MKNALIITLLASSFLRHTVGRWTHCVYQTISPLLDNKQPPALGLILLLLECKRLRDAGWEHLKWHQTPPYCFQRFLFYCPTFWSSADSPTILLQANLYSTTSTIATISTTVCYFPCPSTCRTTIQAAVSHGNCVSPSLFYIVILLLYNAYA